MLNLKKSELMTYVAMYEQGEGKELLSLRDTYESRDARKVRASSIAAGIVAYVLIMAIVYAGWGAGIINFTESPVLSASLCVAALCIGMLFVQGYVRLVDRVRRIRYERARNSIGQYDLNIKRLKTLAREKPDEEK